MRSLAPTAILLVALAAGDSAVPPATAQTRAAQTFRPLAAMLADDEGESDDRIETDRDSFTPSTRTVERRRSVFESSYSFIDGPGAATTHSFPELLTRTGLTDWLELRVGWNYEMGSASDVVSGVEGDEGLAGGGIERESRLLYGFKAWLTDQRRWIPESSVIVQGFTPTSGTATATEITVTSVMGWELPNRWKFDTGLRYSSDHDAGRMVANYAPSAVLRVPVGERWTVHAEYFGQSSQGRTINRVQNFFSMGPHYLINRNFEIGARFGWGLNDQTSRFFSNLGLGYRF